MTAYFVLLSLPAMFALLSQRAARWGALLPVFLIFVVIVGFRYRVGMDWNNYEAIHANMIRFSLGNVLGGSEPLSNMLFWISKRLSNGSLVTNTVAAFILVFGVFSLARQTSDPWIAIVAATPYLVIVIGMSGIRQAMAMGVFLYALSNWYKYSSTKRFMFVAIASMFHTSAIILACFAVLELKMKLPYKVALGLVSGLIGGYFMMRSETYGKNLAFYSEMYVSGGAVVDAPGAVLHLALVAIPATLYLVLRNGRLAALRDNKVILGASLASLSMFLLLPISSMAVSRLSIYLQFLPMIVYAAVANAFGPSNRMPIRIVIIAFNFIVLFVWLNFANNSLAYRQYNFLFF